jgi:hypothetical protein
VILSLYSARVLFAQVSSEPDSSISSVKVSLSPKGPIDFGNVHVFVTDTVKLSLTNKGKDSIAIKSVKVKLTGTGFSADFSRCGQELDPGASCDLAISFGPTADSRYKGALKIEGKRVSLKGTGVGTADAKPAPGDAIFLGGLGFDERAIMLYQAASNDFAPLGSTPFMNIGHGTGATATLLPNGKILIAGGSDQPSTDLYDPTTNSFAPPPQTATMNTARSGATATLLQNGKVLIAGGAAGCSDAGCTLLASTELYDPTTNSFAPPNATASMNVARVDATAALLGTGKVIIAGATADASTELYDPVTNSFAPPGATAVMNVARTVGPSAVDSNGKVVVAGGLVGCCLPAPTGPPFDLYDEATNTFLPASEIPVAVPENANACTSDLPIGVGCVAVVLTVGPNVGKVMILGGYGHRGLAERNTELYDPITNTVAPPGTIPPLLAARSYPGVAVLASGKVLVFGGNVSVPPFELYDPMANAFVIGSPSPLTAFGDAVPLK